MITILLVIACAAVLTVLASVVVTWSSRRSALWNMAFAVVLALAAIGVLAVIAAIVSWFSARAVFRPY